MDNDWIVGLPRRNSLILVFHVSKAVWVCLWRLLSHPLVDEIGSGRGSGGQVLSRGSGGVKPYALLSLSVFVPSESALGLQRLPLGSCQEVATIPHWGESLMRVRSLLPRPEYPRPERQRGFVHGHEWLNLNGAWQFRFDPGRKGLSERWYEPGGGRWHEQIVVPFCWESLAAWGEADAAGNENYFSHRAFLNPVGINRFNYRDAPRQEVGWYRKEISIPHNEFWEHKRVILTVGASDFWTDCWCNGLHMGRHEGGYTPFEFDITETLVCTPGGGYEPLTVVLRVEDPMNSHEQPVGKQWGWYSSVSGIWQTVFLEPRATSYVDHFEITSDLERGSVSLKVFTCGGSELIVEALSPDAQRFAEVLPVKDGVAQGELMLGAVRLWSPNQPQLYKLQLTLSERSEPHDVVHSYFGMRTLSAVQAANKGHPSLLCLNGQPIYLRGALYQSFFPEGIYTAGDVQVLRDDILAAKRFGFDLLRVHIKVDDPLLLYYADTLGILLMADFPNFGEGGDTPAGRSRYEATMREAIKRDFNHPSIVAWCLFNETWGFGGQNEILRLINPKPSPEGVGPHPELPSARLANLDAYAWVESMWNVAKSLDSTRLVEDMSVVAWEHLQYYGHGATDINSWHFYTDSYEEARRHIAEVVSETYEGSSFNYVPGFAQGTQPLINSEYGGVGALDGDRDVSWSFKFLTNELRLHESISAYIFTELHDVEWERNGFLNYDRTPKEFGYDPTIVNQGDVLPIDAPPISRCSPGQRIEAKVYSSHFSRKRLEGVRLSWSLSGVDSFGWHHDNLASGTRPISFSHLRVELAEQVSFALPNTTMLCTLWVRATGSDGTQLAANFVQYYVDAGFLPLEWLDAKTVALRMHPHQWSAGTYGFLVRSTLEGEFLANVFKGTAPSELVLGCVVPEGDPAAGGLVVYGGQSGRYPIPPTLLLEWY